MDSELMKIMTDAEANAAVEAQAQAGLADLVTGPEVWMEGDAVEQLRRVAATPGCVRAVGMPDLHAGPGIPIGAALAFAGTIRPALVGSDAGCGARLLSLGRARHSGDALERRVRAELEENPVAVSGTQPEVLFDAVWQRGVAGLVDVPGVPDSLAALAAADTAAHREENRVACCEAGGDARDPIAPPAGLDRAGFGMALGTIGGGNHFAEISRVDEVGDRDAAAVLGLGRGGAAVLVHSGSRGLGRALAERWGDVVLAAGSAEAERYLDELAGACRYARANRLIIAWRLLRALGETRPHKILGWLDVTHNAVTRERVAGSEGWVHRKGCAPAHAGEPTIVLGSRGAPSWVMLGTGHTGTLCSVAHGAGRRMTRSEARAKISARYQRTALDRTSIGSRVICDRKELLLEEHPDAYKPIEPVVAALETRGMARRVAALMPLITVKQ